MSTKTEAGITLSSPTRRTDGQIGARAIVDVKHADNWNQQYGFDTHGMSSDAVVAKVAEITAYHDSKAARLTAFRKIQGQDVKLGGAAYRIVDCTIFDNGVTLYLDVRRDGAKVPGFPVRIQCYEIGKVPDDETIMKLLTSRLPVEADEIETAHAEFAAKVSMKMEKR